MIVTWRIGQSSSAANGPIRHVAIMCGVHFEHKGGEADVHPLPKPPNEAAATLVVVCPQAVQGVTEIWDVQSLSHQHLLAVQRYDRCPNATHRGEGSVSHADPKITDRTIQDEGTLVRQHVLCGARVGDHQRAAGRNALE